jgi:hypothetical protein
MIVGSDCIGVVLSHAILLFALRQFSIGRHAAAIAGFSRFQHGNKWQCCRLFPVQTEERIMPVLLLWAVPAVIVIGGVGYWMVHLH